LAKSSFDDNNEVKELIGTGPYYATKIEPPQKIEQKAFADYWGEKAKIQDVTYLANSRSETRTLLAQSKPNYLVFTLDSASLSRLQQDPNLQVKSKSLARTIQYKVNAKNPLFSDVNVRQALSDAIDRKAIAQSVMRADNAVAEQILPPIFKDWQIKTATQTPDPQVIKQRLLDLGFTADAKGMLQKEGKPFKFTLRTFSDRPELPIIATALQAQWRKIGVDVDVSVGNFSEIPAGHQDGTLEMALYARNYGMTPDPVGSLIEDFDPKGSDWGVMNWQDSDLTESLLKLETTKDSDVATRQRVSEIIFKERPIVPVVYYQQNAAAHKSLKGLEIDGLERNFYLNKLSW
jgi:peptide/nickel transport system substrate-binding protein